MGRAGRPGALLFPLAALGWSLGLFALSSSPLVQERLVLPLTRLQAQAADHYAGKPTTPVLVTADCSATDVLALCLAAILACPVPWRSRLAGAAGGIALVLGLNTVRIASLGRAAGTPALFDTLHLRVWPAILVLAAAAYVLGWMRLVLRRAPAQRPLGGDEGALSAFVRRFGPRAAVLLVVFALCQPLVARSEALLAAGAWTAGAAAVVLRALGLAATSSANALATSRGRFIVTPECLATALLPLYVAGVLAARLGWRARVLALVAAPPLFGALAVLRLLLLALPQALAASPLFLVHGFHQLVAAAAAVWGLALQRGTATAGRLSRATVRAGAALALAAVLVLVAGRVLPDPPAPAPADAQGALALLPAFQVFLLLALGLVAFPGWRRFLAAFAALLVSQLALLALVAEWTARTGLAPHVLLLRAWALGVPIGLALLMLRGVPRAPGTPAAYRRFWHDVGATFPDLGGAASTAYYLENEKRLLREHVPDLGRCALLKTDLWDEVKNTRILQWARGQGATAFGVDISGPTVGQARAAFPRGGLRAAVADVRRLPFRDASFDAVYSMGTIEHFDESEAALREIHRVLRPGGRAVVGVPNRWDPFLRPALARLLQALGLYDYGDERSFSRRGLRRMLEAAGFEVVAETAILFVPGWLRMADLVLHCHLPRLAPLTAALLRPFVWLDRHVPAVRRHGYLLASVGVRRQG